MSAKLIMKQVTKTYGDGDGAMTVLNNLDFTVNEGEFVAVLGPSGSGKALFSLPPVLCSPQQAGKSSSMVNHCVTKTKGL